MNTTRAVSVGLAAMVFSVSAGMAAASPLPFSFEETFQGPNGSQPDNWVKTVDVDQMRIISNAYRLEWPFADDEIDFPGLRRSLSYTGGSDDVESISSDLWQDYTVTAEFVDSSEFNRSGVYARWQGDSGDPDNREAYWAYQSGNDLLIGKGIPASSDQDTLLASSGLTETFQANNPYRIEFTVDGSSLTARLFDLGQSGEPLIGEVTANDTEYTLGSVGIRARHTFQGRTTDFDFLTVEGTAIPEPASLALIGLGGTILLLGRSRPKHK